MKTTKSALVVGALVYVASFAFVALLSQLRP